MDHDELLRETHALAELTTMTTMLTEAEARVSVLRQARDARIRKTLTENTHRGVQARVARVTRLTPSAIRKIATTPEQADQ